MITDIREGMCVHVCMCSRVLLGMIMDIKGGVHVGVCV